MEAKIVVGLGFGDEGKGITTDFLCSQSKPESTVCVRFSGGQQAGHTVVIGDLKHTYSTFCSGTGRGIGSYLSEYCTFYPPNALNEHTQLVDKGLNPLLYVHPLAKLTTYWDVAWGRLRERIYTHGSCGIGVGATMARQEQSPYKLFVSDLLHAEMLFQKLENIGRYYGDKVKDLGVDKEMEEYYHEQVLLEMNRFWKTFSSVFMHRLQNRIVGYDYLKSFKTLIFEGSQGIMLDMEHGVFPNVTYSSTVTKNADKVCDNFIIPWVSRHVYYVTRCYLTRHGEGWMPSIKALNLVNNEGEHNRYNQWQKDFKIGELDVPLLKYALQVDNAYSWRNKKHLVVTCLDQRPQFKFPYNQLGQFASIHESWSPDSKDFKKITG